MTTYKKTLKKNIDREIKELNIKTKNLLDVVTKLMDTAKHITHEDTGGTTKPAKNSKIENKEKSKEPKID